MKKVSQNFTNAFAPQMPYVYGTYKSTANWQYFKAGGSSLGGWGAFKDNDFDRKENPDEMSALFER